jgi:hypothetical protein
VGQPGRGRSSVIFIFPLRDCRDRVILRESTREKKLKDCGVAEIFQP